MSRLYDQIEYHVMQSFSADIDTELQRIGSATQSLEHQYDQYHAADQQRQCCDIPLLRMIESCRLRGDDAELKKKCLEIREFCKLNADTKFLQKQLSCQQEINRQFQTQNAQLSRVLEEYKTAYAALSTRCLAQQTHNQRLRDFQHDPSLQKLHAQIFENDRQLVAASTRREKYLQATQRAEQRSPELTHDVENERQRLCTLKQQFADSIEVGTRIHDIEQKLLFLRKLTGVRVQLISATRIELVVLRVVVLAMDYEADTRRVFNVRMTRRQGEDAAAAAAAEAEMRDAFSPYLIEMVFGVADALELQQSVHSLTELQNVMWRMVECTQHICDLRRNLNRIQMANKPPYRIVVTPLAPERAHGLKLRVVIARDVQYMMDGGDGDGGGGVDDRRVQQMRTQCLFQCVLTLDLTYPYQALQPQMMVVLNRQIYDEKQGKFKSIRNRMEQMLIEQRLGAFLADKVQNMKLGLDLLGRCVDLLVDELNVVLSNEANLKHDISVYQKL